MIAPRMPPNVPEFVHYYGDWFWTDEQTAWLKSLLLFFDGIVLALPDQAADRMIASHPVLAQPLAEMGLLRNYAPDLWLKSPYKEGVTPVHNFIDAQRQLQSPYDKDVVYVESMAGVEAVLRAASRHSSSKRHFDETMKEFDRLLKLAKQQYGGSPSQMRALSVGVTSWLLSQYVHDILIHPIIDDVEAASFVSSIIGGRRTGESEVILSDLLHLDLDLSTVPLDEVLAFRQKYGSEYRAYARDVRQFVLELSLLPKSLRSSALAARHIELSDRAESLRKTSRNSFMRQAVGISFGIAGAAWTLAHGDFWPAIFASGAAATALTKPIPGYIGATYTYVLRAKNQLAR
jgi:hypothetical protein